jgi:hypothetical protein
MDFSTLWGATVGILHLPLASFAFKGFNNSGILPSKTSIAARDINSNLKKINEMENMFASKLAGLTPRCPRDENGVSSLAGIPGSLLLAREIRCEKKFHFFQGEFP